MNDGFLDWEGAAGGNDVTAVNLASTRVLIASGSAANVPNDQLAVPLLRLLAVQPAKRWVAIESGSDASSTTSGTRALFVDPLRNDNAIKGRVSTVDNIESGQGQVAAVLALAQLADGRIGNYGVGGSADAPAPAPVS